MSMMFDHYVVLGWAVKKDSFDLFSDKLLPFVEGHENVECTLLNGEEETEFAVFGKVLCQADKHNPFDREYINDLTTIDKLNLQDILTGEYYDAFGTPPNSIIGLIAHSIYS